MERAGAIVGAARVLLVASALGLAALHVVEPGLDPREATVSEYALTGTGWLFSASILALSAGSALVLALVWRHWPVRRWLVLVWVLGGVVVALVPTDPVGGPSSVAGAVHTVAATAGIGSLLLAELASVRDPAVRSWSIASVSAAVAALLLTPVVGFGATERVLIGAHIGWLLAVTSAFASSRTPGVPEPAVVG